MNQMELDFSTKVEASDTHAFIAYLLGKGNVWTGAKTIEKELSFSARKIRAMASKSNGKILSGPGSAGYKHIYFASGDEVQQIVHKLRHQAKELDSRSGVILSAWHKSAHSTP